MDIANGVRWAYEPISARAAAETQAAAANAAGGMANATMRRSARVSAAI